MTYWWEIDSPDQPDTAPTFRAVAYYRHSAQDRQENSIPIQQDQVREWARRMAWRLSTSLPTPANRPHRRGTAGIHRADGGMVKKRSDFIYVLCLDVSRWGRFQDIDLSAQFSAECKKHDKQVIYTSIGKRAKTIHSIRSTCTSSGFVRPNTVAS